MEPSKTAIFVPLSHTHTRRKEEGKETEKDREKCACKETSDCLQAEVCRKWPSLECIWQVCQILTYSSLTYIDDRHTIHSYIKDLTMFTHIHLRHTVHSHLMTHCLLKHLWLKHPPLTLHWRLTHCPLILRRWPSNRYMHKCMRQETSWDLWDWNTSIGNWRYCKSWCLGLLIQQFWKQHILHANKYCSS